MICLKCAKYKHEEAMWTDGICCACQFPPNPHKCHNCGVPSEKHLCPACDDLQQADSWRRICPPLFLHTEVLRLPPQLANVLEWQMPCTTGLLLSGPPGAGKTRCAIQLLRRLHWESWSMVITSGFEFATDCGRGLMDGSWYEQLQQMMQTPVLFIDDLDKCKMTETVETQLFGLIDYRSSHMRPLIVTLNSGKAELEQRFSDVRGGPIIRRLSEFSTTVRF